MTGFLPQLSWINQIMIPDYRAKLKLGWDGYHGKIPTEEAMATARLMSLVPGGDGSLQFEIHTKVGSVEIFIASNGCIEYVHSTIEHTEVEGKK